MPYLHWSKTLRFIRLRLVSLLTILCFLTSELYASTPYFSAEIFYSSQQPQIQDDLSVLFNPTDPKDIEFLKAHAEIVELARGSRKGWVIYIQDAHLQEEAQRSISKLIRFLADRYHFTSVGIEGASGELAHSLLSAYPHEGARHLLAENFLKQGWINGAEYAALAWLPKLKLIGLENPEAYEEHRRLFLKSMDSRKEIEPLLKAWRRRLDSLSQILLPFDFKGYLYKKMEAQDEHDIFDLIQQTKRLRKKFHLKKPFPQLDNAERFHELQSRLIQSRLHTELAQLKFSKAPEALRKTYAGWLQAVEQGKLFPAARLAQNLTAVPTFQEQYPQLVLLSQWIETVQKMSAELFDELEVLELLLARKLLLDPQQKELYHLLKIYSVIDKMSRLELTEPDLLFFNRHREDFEPESLQERWAEFEIRGMEKDQVPWELFEKGIRQEEAFYTQALKRDSILAQNAVRYLEKTNEKRMLLIAGGFHTPGIRSFLRRQNYNYLILRPHFKTLIPEDKQSQIYLREMQQSPEILGRVLKNIEEKSTAAFLDPILQLNPPSRLPSIELLGKSVPDRPLSQIAESSAWQLVLLGAPLLRIFHQSLETTLPDAKKVELAMQSPTTSVKKMKWIHRLYAPLDPFGSGENWTILPMDEWSEEFFIASWGKNPRLPKYRRSVLPLRFELRADQELLFNRATRDEADLFRIQQNWKAKNLRKAAVKKPSRKTTDLKVKALRTELREFPLSLREKGKHKNLNPALESKITRAPIRKTPALLRSPFVQRALNGLVILGTAYSLAFFKVQGEESRISKENKAEQSTAKQVPKIPSVMKRLLEQSRSVALEQTNTAPGSPTVQASDNTQKTVRKAERGQSVLPPSPSLTRSESEKRSPSLTEPPKAPLNTENLAGTEKKQEPEPAQEKTPEPQTTDRDTVASLPSVTSTPPEPETAIQNQAHESVKTPMLAGAPESSPIDQLSTSRPGWRKHLQYLKKIPSEQLDWFKTKWHQFFTKKEVQDQKPTESTSKPKETLSEKRMAERFKAYFQGLQTHWKSHIATSLHETSIRKWLGAGVVYGILVYFIAWPLALSPAHRFFKKYRANYLSQPTPTLAKTNPKPHFDSNYVYSWLIFTGVWISTQLEFFENWIQSGLSLLNHFWQWAFASMPYGNELWKSFFDFPVPQELISLAWIADPIGWGTALAIAVLAMFAWRFGSLAFRLQNEWIHLTTAKALDWKATAFTKSNLKGGIQWRDWLRAAAMVKPLPDNPKVGIPEFKNAVLKTPKRNDFWTRHAGWIGLFIMLSAYAIWAVPYVINSLSPFSYTVVSWSLSALVVIWLGGVNAFAASLYSDLFPKGHPSGTYCCGVSGTEVYLGNGNATDFEMLPDLNHPSEDDLQMTEMEKDLVPKRAKGVNIRKRVVKMKLEELPPHIRAEIPDWVIPYLLEMTANVNLRGDQARGEVIMVTVVDGHIVKLEIMGHDRFTTGGKNDKVNAQPHIFIIPHEEEVYGVVREKQADGSYKPKIVKKRVRVALYIGHNGDYNGLKKDPKSSRFVPLGEARKFYKEVFHFTHRAVSDTPQLAAEMERTLSQGRLKSALRYAFSETMQNISGRDEYSDPKLLETWETMFQSIFEREFSEGRVAPQGFYLSSVPRSQRDQLILQFEQMMTTHSNLFPEKFFGDQSRRQEFLNIAIQAFFDHDLYESAKKVKSRVRGSFGVKFVYTLQPGSSVVFSDKQSIFQGINGERKAVATASESNAVKPKFKDGSGMTHRLDLDSAAQTVVEIKGGDPYQKKGEPFLGIQAHSVTFDRPLTAREIFEMTVPLEDNPLLSPYQDLNGVRDKVEYDRRRIPTALKKIEDSWKEDDRPLKEQSFNRRTGFEILQMLMVKDILKRIRIAANVHRLAPQDKKRILAKAEALARTILPGSKVKPEQFQAGLLSLINEEVADLSGGHIRSFTLAQLMNLNEEMKKRSPAVDAFFFGMELSESFGFEAGIFLENLFPGLNIEVIDSNELLPSLSDLFPLGEELIPIERDGGRSLILDEDSIGFEVTNGGQQFSAVVTGPVLNELLPGRVFNISGTLDTLAAFGLGQRYYRGAPFIGRTLITYTDGGAAEAATLVPAANAATINHLGYFLATHMKKWYGPLNPHGMFFQLDDLEVFKKAQDESFYKHIPEMIQPRGKVSQQYPRAGRAFLWYALEFPIALLSAAFIFATAHYKAWDIFPSAFFEWMGSFFAPGNLIFAIALGVFISYVWGKWHGYQSTLIKYTPPLSLLALQFFVPPAISFVFNIVFVLVLGAVVARVFCKWIGGYPWTLRFSPVKTITVGDQIAPAYRKDQYISKLWSQAYGFMTVFVRHGKATSRLTHDEHHRTVRGSWLQLRGREDSFLKVSRHASAVSMTQGQANGLGNFGAGPNFLKTRRAKKGENPQATTYGKNVFEIVLPPFETDIRTETASFLREVQKNLKLSGALTARLEIILANWTVAYRGQHLSEIVNDIAKQLKLSESKIPSLEVSFKRLFERQTGLERLIDERLDSFEDEQVEYGRHHWIVKMASLNGWLWDFSHTLDLLKNSSTAAPQSGDDIDKLSEHLKRLMLRNNLKRAKNSKSENLTAEEERLLPFRVLRPMIEKEDPPAHPEHPPIVIAEIGDLGQLIDALNSRIMAQNGVTDTQLVKETTALLRRLRREREYPATVINSLETAFRERINGFPISRSRTKSVERTELREAVQSMNSIRRQSILNEQKAGISEMIRELQDLGFDLEDPNTYFTTEHQEALGIQGPSNPQTQGAYVLVNADDPELVKNIEHGLAEEIQLILFYDQTEEAGLQMAKVRQEFETEIGTNRIKIVSEPNLQAYILRESRRRKLKERTDLYFLELGSPRVAYLNETTVEDAVYLAAVKLTENRMVVAGHHLDLNPARFRFVTSDDLITGLYQSSRSSRSISVSA